MWPRPCGMRACCKVSTGETDQLDQLDQLDEIDEMTR